MGAPAEQRSSRAERRNDHRRRLLQAIEQLTIGGESYADVSIERLATEAGLSRATFYTYFEGKGDLLGAWFDDAVAELGRAFDPWLQAGSSRAELRETLERVALTFRPHAMLFAAITDEATQDAALRERINDAIEQAIARVRDHIELGQAEGWVDPELLPRETAAWIVWMLERGLTQIVGSADEERLPALIETLAAMGWQTLYAGAPKRR